MFLFLCYLKIPNFILAEIYNIEKSIKPLIQDNQSTNNHGRKPYLFNQLE